MGVILLLAYAIIGAIVFAYFAHRASRGDGRWWGLKALVTSAIAIAVARLVLPLVFSFIGVLLKPAIAAVLVVAVIGLIAYVVRKVSASA